MKFSRLLFVSFCYLLFVTDCFSREKFSLGSILDGNSAGYASFIENRHYYLRTQQILWSDFVYDSVKCALNCLVMGGCRSFNFRLREEFDGKHLCELLASDKFKQSSHFVPSSKYYHYSITTSCEYTPCQHGSTCGPLYETHGFVCHCVPGYIGDFCHIKVPSWLKINTKEVCFGARDDSYGTFSMPYNGDISSFKLVHLSGRVSCGAGDDRFSNWGCKVIERLATFLTDASNKIVFPQVPEVKAYKLPGIWSNSTELTFNNLTVTMRVSTGQQFRVWYMEDLKDVSERDNGGKTCMDIYALYV